jgi:hypothetical protein
MDASERLVGLVRAEPVDASAIAQHLDHLTLTDRVNAMRALGGAKLQGRLYAALAAKPRVTLADLVPVDAPPLREFIFHGKNSLPAFTIFQKRFCRPPAARARDQLWGYNHQALAWVTGPGYFVAHDDPRGAALDYREVPPERPATWPEIAPNERGLSRFVYANMVDYMRRVSRDVFIGSAFRGGREAGNYFMLCRDA